MLDLWIEFSAPSDVCGELVFFSCYWVIGLDGKILRIGVLFLATLTAAFIPRDIIVIVVASPFADAFEPSTIGPVTALTLPDN
jgi:hypothetical protein